MGLVSGVISIEMGRLLDDDDCDLELCCFWKPWARLKES